MRISFDMDDTLVPSGEDGKARADCRLLSGELLREGALELLRDLQKRHEIWIYTTSLRSPLVLWLSFRLKGIRIAQVVNEELHQLAIRRYQFEKPPSKYPKHFGIELHVDDSVGVLEEGRQFGFDVLRVDPGNPGWAEAVRNAVSAPPLPALDEIADRLRGYRGNGKDGVKKFHVQTRGRMVIAVPEVYRLNSNSFYPVVVARMTPNCWRTRGRMNWLGLLFVIAFGAATLYMGLMEGEKAALVVVPAALLPMLHFAYFRLCQQATEIVRGIVDGKSPTGNSMNESATSIDSECHDV